IPVTGGPSLAPGTAGYLGTDLSGSHPVSFVYDDALAIENNAAGDMPLRLPSTLDDIDVKLDAQGRIQCTTCHDPHDDSNYVPNRVPHFYVKPSWSAVCLTCHDY
ncbi:MAG: cytochrome c3 family protein, partial [Planctomycetota bacterium]